MNEENSLLTGAVRPALLRYALPIILSMVATQFYAVADTMIIGLRLDADALAAVSNASTVLMIFLFLGLLGAFMFLPLLYSILNAFKPLEEIYMYPPRFFVRNPTTENFSLLLKLTANLWVPFSRYVFNSVFVTAACTVGHTVVASMVAYPLAKFPHLRLQGVFRVVVLSLLFSSTVLWIPQFIILSRLHLVNTVWVFILPALPSAVGVFLMKQFMEQIPFVLVESALIDGASHWRTFWQIVMPQVKPAWLTLTVFAFQASWNQASGGLVYDEQRKLLSDAIAQIMAGGYSRVGPSMAGTVMMLIPPILLFLFTQNQVIETMAYSGIKE